LIEEKDRTGDEIAPHIDPQDIDVGGDSVAVVFDLPHIESVSRSHGVFDLEGLESFKDARVAVGGLEDREIRFVVYPGDLRGDASPARRMLELEKSGVHTHLGGDEDAIALEDGPETTSWGGGTFFPGTEEGVVLQGGIDPHDRFLRAGLLRRGTVGEEGEKHRQGEGGVGRSEV
jgi:hypothetical protein